MTYTVSTDQYEGPIDALLDIISSGDLDISRLSLACVADQFVEYVETNDNIPLEQIADFLTVASRLLLIKSRALLPVLEVDEEEEGEIMDLQWQLETYKRFKEVSEEIRILLEGEARLYRREAYCGVEHETTIVPVEYNFHPDEIAEHMQAVISRMPNPDELKRRVIRKIVSVGEKVRYLKALITKNRASVFSQIMGERPDRDEVSVSFLAILELTQSRTVRVRQESHFGEIHLEYHKE